MMLFRWRYATMHRFDKIAHPLLYLFVAAIQRSCPSSNIVCTYRFSVRFYYWIRKSEARAPSDT